MIKRQYINYHSGFKKTIFKRKIDKCSPLVALVGLESFLDPAADWGLDPPVTDCGRDPAGDGGFPDPGLDSGLSLAAETGLAEELGLSPVADTLPDTGLADVGLDPSFDPENSTKLKQWLASLILT